MNKLSDRMWITRKARINMEHRLINIEKICTYLIPWYSIIIIAFSLLCKNIDSDIKNNISIIGSIIVLVASSILSQRDLKREIAFIKKQYIKINKLIDEAKIAEDKNSDTSDIADRYSKLLASTRNHSENDFRKVKIDCILRKKANPMEDFTVPQPSPWDWISYLGSYLFNILFIIILFSLPFIIFFIYG